MKASPFFHTKQSGFTLIEVMISSAAVGVTGIMIYYVLLTGFTLFTKNTAINMAHQEARSAVMHMEQNIHGAVSLPRLTSAVNPPTYVSGSGPTVGISFQEYNSGPYEITPGSTAITGMPLGTSATGYNSNSTSITVRCTGGFIPTQELRLIIPDYQIEATVNAVTVAGSGTGYTDYNITLMDDSQAPTNSPTTDKAPYLFPAFQLGNAVRTSYTGVSGSSTVNYNVVCFFTNRVSYVVNGSQLLYYANPQFYTLTPKVLANSITSNTPFSIPSTPLGAQFSRFVAAVNMVTADSQTTHLQFRAANMFLNSMEPYRARLCTFQ
jgi:prepilin-type N-terminal cleavage/methylation domain-containing protein